MKKEITLKPRELELLGRFYDAYTAYHTGFRDAVHIDAGDDYDMEYDCVTLELKGLVFVVGDWLRSRQYSITESGRQFWLSRGMPPSKRIEKWNAAISRKATR